jgi:hypothetical protein
MFRNMTPNETIFRWGLQTAAGGGLCWLMEGLVQPPALRLLVPTLFFGATAVKAHMFYSDAAQNAAGPVQRK